MPRTPMLEMLWEDADPAEVLRERFHHPDGASAARWVGGALSEGFGIHMSACERIVMSDRNALAWVETDHGRLVLKWCVAPERYARLDALARLTAWLDGRGIPVSAPVAAIDGSPQIETDGVSLGVQRVIDGDLLDADDDPAVRHAGATLAHLHGRLAAYPAAAAMPGRRAPEHSMRSQITRWLDRAPEHQPAAALETLRRLVDAAPEADPPVQLVHGDYRAANLLCRDGRVTAVLDLEEARVDRTIAELARSAVLLGTRFHDWGPVSPHVRELLREGYASVRPLTAAEAAWWEPLVLWWSLLMIPAGDDPTHWREAALAQAGVGG